MDSNRRIGTAMGILMASHGITYDAAFTRLRIASQDHNRRLREIADEVVFTGEIPSRTARTALPGRPLGPTEPDGSLLHDRATAPHSISLRSI